MLSSVIEQGLTPFRFKLHWRTQLRFVLLYCSLKSPWLHYNFTMHGLLCFNCLSLLLKINWCINKWTKECNFLLKVLSHVSQLGYWYIPCSGVDKSPCSNTVPCSSTVISKMTQKKQPAAGFFILTTLFSWHFHFLFAKFFMSIGLIRSNSIIIYKLLSHNIFMLIINIL